jgi:hypothetical protein
MVLLTRLFMDDVGILVMAYCEIANPLNHSDDV